MTTEDSEPLPAMMAACRESAAKVLAALPEKPRVAVLEDDATMARTYARVLSELVEVVVFETGEAFVEKLRRKPFDLVLTDSLGLPFITTIKDLAPDLPIVVISGSKSPKHLPHGVDKWLTKPLSKRELCSLVEHEVRALTPS